MSSLLSSSSSSSNSMDGINIIRQYVDKMVDLNHNNHSNSSSSSSSTSTTTVPMKILLLDAITTQIMSAVYTQTEILQHHIYLVSTLEKSVQQKHITTTNATTTTPTNTSLVGGGKHRNSSSTSAGSSNSHLTAICFVRPTSTNIDLLCHELQQPPHYMEYHIYFTGTVGGSSTNNYNGSGSLSATSNNKNSKNSSSSSSSSSSSNNDLRKIAESDIYEKVKHIYEYYSDFVPVNHDLWTLQCRNSIPMTVSAGTSYAPQHANQYERHISSICHMLLAMKKYPSQIRYGAHSPCAEEMAKDIADMILNDTTDRYHFRNTTGTIGSNSSSSSSSNHHHHHNTNNQPPHHASSNGSGGFVLLIVDRRDDPVTPLLSQWTYQAMVHELLGLNNHRVILKGAPDITKELEEVVLSTNDDEFYQQHQFSNFGVLGEAIQQLLREYQQQSAHHTSGLRSGGINSNDNNNHNLATVADMQQFMEKYPELRTKSHVVSKHVAIMSELARLVQLCSLMDVSQFEQALACQDDHSTHWRELLDKLSSTTIKIPDKLRLSLLYALRYETSANLHMLQQMMSKGGVPPNMISYVPTILRYSGYQQRTSNRLYAESHNFMSKMTKNIVGAVAGVDNVYAQHVPLIIDIVQQLLRGKLPSKDYPIVSTIGSSSHHNNNNSFATNGVGHNRASSMPSPPHHHSSPPKSNNSSYSINTTESMIPDEILIFMVGGVTYEEGMKIAELNKSLSMNQQHHSQNNSNHQHRIRIVLAGSTIHNSTSFLDELRATAM